MKRDKGKETAQEIEDATTLAVERGAVLTEEGFDIPIRKITIEDIEARQVSTQQIIDFINESVAMDSRLPEDQITDTIVIQPTILLTYDNESEIIFEGFIVDAGNNIEEENFLIRIHQDRDHKIHRSICHGSSERTREEIRSQQLDKTSSQGHEGMGRQDDLGLLVMESTRGQERRMEQRDGRSETIHSDPYGEAKRVEARTLRFGEEPINDPQPETRYLRGSLDHHDPLPVYVHPFYSKDLCGEEWEDIISREEEEGWSSIYTDGSRREGKTGAGVHQGSKDTSVYLGRQCTVNDGEPIAVGEALEREGELLVITDSRVTIAKLQRIARGDLTPEGPARLVRRRWEERINRGEHDIAVM
ncbi:hypothetical protein BDZ91DRAFT_848641 [Kalaharituber pfeilii]|nr:hypothetical protein BDZ91DRAFT_848641 [Kalaharituber pfeilii]